MQQQAGVTPRLEGPRELRPCSPGLQATCRKRDPWVLHQATATPGSCDMMSLL